MSKPDKIMSGRFVFVFSFVLGVASLYPRLFTWAFPYWKQIKCLRAKGTEAFCTGDIASAAEMFSKALQIDDGLNTVIRKSPTEAAQNLKVEGVKER